MCYNCGCQRPDDQMGNPANITTATFQKAAQAMGMTVKEAMENTVELAQSELAKMKDEPAK